MRKEYFCPNCAALITCGDRFCGNCGTALRWVIPQMLGLEEVQDYATRLQEGNGEQTRLPGGEAKRETANSAIGTLPPLHTEISKLLAEFEQYMREHRQSA